MFDNYFSLFQLPNSLPVDHVALSAKYQQLQRQYHPDNFATANDSEKSAIMQQSANINQAYQTLKDPIKAAEYRISLAGIDIYAEHETIHDTDFLFEQFELREILDNIEQAQDWQALDAFYHQILQQKQAVYSQLLQLIDQQNWQIAKNELYKLRYYARLIEQIELLQEKQFDF